MCVWAGGLVVVVVVVRVGVVVVVVMSLVVDVFLHVLMFLVVLLVRSVGACSVIRAVTWAPFLWARLLA
jgi:hypothetical protein